MIEREPARYLPALLGLLSSPNVPPQALYWAVKIVGRLNRPEARAPLLALAAQPLAPELKAAAVEGVVAFGREADVPFLLQVVNDPSPLVRQEALKGLLRFPAREDARIRLAAIAGVRQLRDQRALEYLVECLKLPPQARETREAAWQALKELAGQERPLNYSAWKTWWENNQFIETFARPRLNPSPTPPP